MYYKNAKQQQVADERENYFPGRHLWFGTWAGQAPTVEDVFSLFTRYGPVENIQMKDTYGFVNFMKASCAITARQEFNQKDVKLCRWGANFRVRYARGTPYRIIWVGNLDPAVNKSDLHKAFSDVGSIDGILLFQETQGAYIFFSAADDATRAVTIMQGYNICGAPIHCDFAISEDSKLSLEEDIRAIRKRRGGHMNVLNGLAGDADQRPLLPAKWFVARTKPDFGNAFDDDLFPPKMLKPLVKPPAPKATEPKRDGAFKAFGVKRKREDDDDVDKLLSSIRADSPEISAPSTKRIKQEHSPPPAVATPPRFVRTPSPPRAELVTTPMSPPASPRSSDTIGGPRVWEGYIAKRGVIVCKTTAYFLLGAGSAAKELPRTIDLDSHTALLGLTNYISSNNLQQPAILFMQPTSVDDSFSFAGLHDSLLRQGRTGVAMLPDQHALDRVYLVPIDSAAASMFGIDSDPKKPALIAVVAPRVPV